MLAVVLSRQDFKEYDQIISLYTFEEGRRDLLARGIKKIVSKNAAHLEPCSVVEVGIAKGKDMDIVTNVQIEKYFPDIRKNYYKSLVGLWGVTITKNFFSSPDPDQRVFLLLSSWLEYINLQEDISPYLLDAFLLRSLGYLGFTPVLDECVECERKRTGDIFFFSPSRGGITCIDCRLKISLPGEKWYRLDRVLLEALESVIFAPWEKLFGLNVQKKFYLKVHHLVFSFLQYHLETKVTDWWKLAKISKILI